MDNMRRLQAKESSLAVIGLGYVGLPLAVAFAEHFLVIGYDNNTEKIRKYMNGNDPTGEIGDAVIQASTMQFTSDEARLSEANFIIIAVPTPIHGDKTPDLGPVKSATRKVAKNLSVGTIVVYESTVYPGVTEEVCLPILEKISGLQGGKDFYLGYSPERINPGDYEHRLHNIVKIVSGQDKETLMEIKSVYDTIIEKTYPAPTIKIAEAAKLVENAQRDINIAFMNELAMAFHRMGIDTKEVMKAMSTKWNALSFKPGLVGGHCIGVDPYYFIYKAENLGYHSQIIAAGRRINDGMSEYVAKEIIKAVVFAKLHPATMKVYLLGMTFKEDCPDLRNSRALDVYYQLKEYGIDALCVDPVASKDEFKLEYGLDLIHMDDIVDADCLVILVTHEQFRRLNINNLSKLYKQNNNTFKMLFDVKGIYEKQEAEKEGFIYWNL